MCNGSCNSNADCGIPCGTCFTNPLSGARSCIDNTNYQDTVTANDGNPVVSNPSMCNGSCNSNADCAGSQCGTCFTNPLSGARTCIDNTNQDTVAANDGNPVVGNPSMCNGSCNSNADCGIPCGTCFTNPLSGARSCIDNTNYQDTVTANDGNPVV